MAAGRARKSRVRMGSCGSSEGGFVPGDNGQAFPLPLARDTLLLMRASIDVKETALTRVLWLADCGSGKLAVG